jgi:hypothetical protein
MVLVPMVLPNTRGWVYGAAAERVAGSDPGAMVVKAEGHFAGIFHQAQPASVLLRFSAAAQSTTASSGPEVVVPRETVPRESRSKCDPMPPFEASWRAH